MEKVRALFLNIYDATMHFYETPQITTRQLSEMLRTAATYEGALIDQIDALEKELKQLGAVREWRELTEEEQSAIAFCADMAGETQKLVKKVVQLKALVLSGKEYKNLLSEIKETISTIIKHLEVLNRLVKQIESIKARRSAA
ncbi:MAG: hypothetical protein QXT19_01495 [Candidatus Woesearchaeota archaeon]